MGNRLVAGSTVLNETKYSKEFFFCFDNFFCIIILSASALKASQHTRLERVLGVRFQDQKKIDGVKHRGVFEGYRVLQNVEIDTDF